MMGNPIYTALVGIVASGKTTIILRQKVYNVLRNLVICYHF